MGRLSVPSPFVAPALPTRIPPALLRHCRTEKDCIEWAKARLGELFADRVFLKEGGNTLKTTGLQSCSGEAFLNVRKNKLIPRCGGCMRVVTCRGA